MPGGHLRAQAATPFLTVLIADDDGCFSIALAEYLQTSAAIELAAAAGDAQQAAALALELQPDVALVDVHRPGEGAVQGILSASPGTRVIALSATGDSAGSLRMLRAGASGSIVKGAGPGEILAAVVRTFRGAERNVEAADDGRRGERIAAVIDEGRISPVFQPIVDLSNGCTVGYEALARFDAEPPNSPQWWFADAEAAGVRTELELAAAEAALQRFRAYGGPGFLTLNASPLALTTLGRLACGLGDKLVIEITEHAAIDDYDLIVQAIDRLRAQGVRFAIDDAGAGFASFRHVLELDPDYVKLDVSLTRGLDRDLRRRALVYGLNAFADELDITIVAEGVERHAELETLLELGVPLGQGNFLGRPGRLPG